MHSVMGSPNKIERVNVLGVGVSAINLDMAKRTLVDAVRQKTKGYVCVTGVHGVMEAQADPLRGLLLHHPPDLGRKPAPVVCARRIALEDLHSEARHLVRVALDGHVALEHRAA